MRPPPLTPTLALLLVLILAVGSLVLIVQGEGVAMVAVFWIALAVAWTIAQVAG